MSVGARGFWLLTLAWTTTAALAQSDRVVPRREYYLAFGPFFEGDYGTALDAFQSAARGGVRSTEGLWVDSICYHAMMGECYYQMGNMAKALGHYDSAAQLAAFHSQWLLRVDFPDAIAPSGSAVRATISWGSSSRNTRLARIPDTMAVLQGHFNNNEVLKRGGVVAPPQYVPVNVKEIVRCTALAIRRRRDIMGPLCAQSDLTNQLVAALSRRPAQPNHWSQAWISCQLGLAYAAAGKPQQAVPELKRSLMLAGQYDHDLTATGLLELGRIAFDQEQYPAAARYYLESTYAAAAFEQYDVMKDAFRGGLRTHLVTGQQGMYAPLGPAAIWARRYSRALHADLLLMAAENYAAWGQTAQAARVLAEARQAVGRREMGSGRLGARFAYLSAMVEYQRGSLAAGDAQWATAMSAARLSSPRLFQIGLANAYYASGKSLRVSDLLFGELLREPTSADWSVDPMETLTVAVTPHAPSLEHWLDAALQRNEQEKAIEISDRIRRHRFFSTLPMGGRLVALRWILEAPAETLDQQARLQRQDLLARYANYGQLSRQVGAIRTSLEALPLIPQDADQKREQAKLFGQLADASAAQEGILRDIALRREPTQLVFPPLRTLQEIQQAMPAGQLILAYLATDRYIMGCAVGKQQHAVWQVAAPAKLADQIAQLLKQWGLSDRRAPITRATLEDDAWQPMAAELLDQLSNHATAANWAEYRDIVVVPDGMLWYVPFEALQIQDGDRYRPLIAQARVRYVPTLSLANGDARGSKPNARTAVVTGKMLPGQDPKVTAEAFAEIRRVLPDAQQLDAPLPAPSAYFSAACDRAIVLNDLQRNAPGPYAWAPMFVDRAKAGDSLARWLALPWYGPPQIVLPGLHTPAENALKQGGTGNELFLAVCGLMAAGSRSVLLSRWPVGGQSTFDLIREYIQELPYVPAAEAWQRSVRLNGASMLEPDREPRIKASDFHEPIRAEHPFFWAGYLLADTGNAPQADAP